MGGAGGGMGDEGRPREMYAPKEREVEDLWGNQVKTGINFSKYDSIPVKVLGENKPPAIVNFQNSGLATVLLENILRAQYTVPEAWLAYHHGEQGPDGKRSNRQWKNCCVPPSYHRPHHFNKGTLWRRAICAGSASSDHHSHQGAGHPDQ